MLLDELRHKRRQINDACHQFGARRIRAFGSVARGEERADSDIDFLVDLPRAHDLFAQRLPLQQKLAEITGRPIDLIPEHELSANIRTSVLSEAMALWPSNGRHMPVIPLRPSKALNNNLTLLEHAARAMLAVDSSTHPTY